MFTNEEWKTYLKVKHELLLEDARNYTKNYIEMEDDKAVNIDDVTEEQFESIDFEQMVSDFEERTDYSDPTADIWESIVSNYRDYGYF